MFIVPVVQLKETFVVTVKFPWLLHTADPGKSRNAEKTNTKHNTNDKFTLNSLPLIKTPLENNRYFKFG